VYPDEQAGLPGKTSEQAVIWRGFFRSMKTEPVGFSGIEKRLYL
jgi:hypothetical protein